MNLKRVILFAGHYGSGKTNIAVNLALSMAARGERMLIADLDIVNPYFRTKDSEQELRAAGIEVIASPYANTNLDAPALPPEMYRICRDRQYRTIVDVGGDDQGAVALGRYAPELRDENDFDLLFVANCCRPLTRTPGEALAVMEEITLSGGLPFTGIVNNANLGPETTPEVIEGGAAFCRELSRMTGLPFLMSCGEQAVLDKLGTQQEALFPLKLQKKL